MVAFERAAVAETAETHLMRLHVLHVVGAGIDRAAGLEEQERLLANMGDCEAMILRNHGLLTVGGSVGEAFNNMYRLERSCRSQLMAMACNDKIVIPPQDIIEKTNHMYRPGTRRPYGVLEWPAMRRMADRIDPSYKN